VQRLAAHDVGVACGLLGAGREVKGAAVDSAAGVELVAKVGDEVEVGTPVARLHVGRPERVPEAMRLMAGAYTIGAERPEARPLVLGRVR